MSRLIDQPGAQVPQRVVVDRSVLVPLLHAYALYIGTATAMALGEQAGAEAAAVYTKLAEQVASGELVSLTVGEWRELGQPVSEPEPEEKWTCEQCGEGWMSFTRSRRYQRDGEIRCELTYDCTKCDHEEIIDAQTTQPEMGGGE